MSNQRGKIKGFYPDMNFKAGNKKTKGAGSVQVFFWKPPIKYLGRLFPACCLMHGVDRVYLPKLWGEHLFRLTRPYLVPVFGFSTGN